MAVTAGALSQLSSTYDSLTLISQPATAGVGPYTYQWYMAQTSGFVPGGGNILAGKTSLEVTVSGLLPNTQYYFKVIATDTGDSNTTDTSDPLLGVSGPAAASMNQFSQSPILGQVDLLLNPNTLPVQVDRTQVGYLYPGSPVKLVANAARGGVPKVVGVTAITDEAYGIINYNIKQSAFVAGDPVEISSKGNAIFMIALAAMNQGDPVGVSLLTVGGVVAPVPTANVIGRAYDTATASGQYIRVMLDTPSNQFET